MLRESIKVPFALTMFLATHKGTEFSEHVSVLIAHTLI